MKEKFRSYVWECNNCGMTWDKKPRGKHNELCTPECVLKQAPQSILMLLNSVDIPNPFCEYRFHPQRKWEFDWAWPEHNTVIPTVHEYNEWIHSPIAIEIDGGAYENARGQKSGHHTIQGRRDDNLKRNEAVLLGWRVLVFEPREITSGAFLATLQRLWES